MDKRKKEGDISIKLGSLKMLILINETIIENKRIMLIKLIKFKMVYLTKETLKRQMQMVMLWRKVDLENEKEAKKEDLLDYRKASLRREISKEKFSVKIQTAPDNPRSKLYQLSILRENEKLQMSLQISQSKVQSKINQRKK